MYGVETFVNPGCIYLAKDDGELHQNHMKDFFQRINQMEDHYKGRPLFLSGGWYVFPAEDC